MARDEAGDNRSPRKQSIKQQRRRGGRSDHEPVIDPSRMIALGVAPSGPDQIVRREGKTRIGDAERHQHKARERLADLLAFGMFDQLADEQITHIRIRPTRAGLGPSRVLVHPVDQFAGRPRRMAACHRVMVVSE